MNSYTEAVHFHSGNCNSNLRRVKKKLTRHTNCFCIKKDNETKEFIKSSIDQADSWLIQTWYNIAKSVMSWLPLTQTDMNGYLQRGTMFVISSDQLKLLLSHASIRLDGLYKILVLILLFITLSNLFDVIQ